MGSSGLESRLRLLYICGNEADEGALEHVRGLIDSGVTAVQLRLKGAEGGDLYRSAAAMARVCRERGALFFVDDRLDIALASGADGVHLGRLDLPVSAARSIAPDGFLIGATARDAAAANEAFTCGADYIGSGAAFKSGTKLDTTVIGPGGIARVAAAARLPVVAIGGIGLENLPGLSGIRLSGVAASAALSGGRGILTAKKMREMIEGGILS
jgi:thiamine-phosphate pyrophosphorylase